VEDKIFQLKTTSGEVICKKMIVARSMFSRMKGLMFSTDLPDCDGFLISPCNSIHTFFMLYALDVVFLDDEFKVVKIIRNLSPWRMTLIYFKARHVLEMKAETLTRKSRSGDQLEAICIS
jgi:uncharacterized membrane protein (UPF0127 family)